METGFWKTLALAQRAMSDLNRLNAATCTSMRNTEKRTAATVAESRELMRRIDAVLARDPWKASGQH
jgi:hypothetical protein